MQVLTVNPEQIPAILRSAPQWVVWKAEITPTSNGKATKVPYDPRTGKPAKSNDPATWQKYEHALSAYRKGGYAGVGFMFSAPDPFAGIDFDKCINQETGEIAEWAREFLDELDSYSEISPSGTGIKVIVRGRLPRHGKGECHHKQTGFGDDRAGAVEMYDELRFFTLTGRRLDDYPPTPEERADALTSVYRRVFREKLEKAQRPAARPASSSDTTGLLSDAEILRLAMKSDKIGDAFSRLWAGDPSGYNGDDSSADCALCSYLAFFTGPDPARIDELFRRSGLYREKWEREGYRDRTIRKALQGKTEFYSAGRWLNLGGSNGKAQPNGQHAPAAPLVLSQDAEPPLRRFDALKKNRKFKQTVERARSDFKDPSLETYDLSAASLAARAGWADQEIANLLIYCRSENGEDLKSVLDPEYVAGVIQKARQGSEEQQAAPHRQAAQLLAEKQKTAGEDGPDPEAVRALILEALGIQVEKVVKYLGEPPQFELVTPAGNVMLGDAAGILSQARFRTAVANTFSRCLPSFKAEEWTPIAQALMDLREEQDPGPEATGNGQLSRWLETYLNSERPTPFDDVAVSEEQPVLKGGCIYLYLGAFHDHLSRRHSERIASHMLAQRLKRFGAEREQLNYRKGQDGPRSTKSYWRLPAEYGAVLENAASENNS
ncbi:MAG: hypothetical protein ACK47B_21690 [Armatimonadota bacterium]